MNPKPTIADCCGSSERNIGVTTNINWNLRWRAGSHLHGGKVIKFPVVLNHLARPESFHDLNHFFHAFTAFRKWLLKQIKLFSHPPGADT